MSDGGAYGIDLASVVSHVAASLDRARPRALSAGELAAGYKHKLHGDLTRIREHEGCATDADATLWLISRAVGELRPRTLIEREDGKFRLAAGKTIEDLQWQGKKVYAVAASNDKDEQRALRAAYNDLNEDRSFWVTVTGAKGGGARERQLTLHPLARAIPQMSEKEFADLGVDVKANGVRLPITVMDGKVIDGRHRLAVAAALKVPVRVEEFTGGEDAARHHIVSLNLVRRNLTMAQRGLIVRQILLPEAEAEARERQLANLNVNPESAPNGANSKASEIAAQRSSGLASTRTIERMAPVDHAPRTQERIRRGEIRSATDARREALRETGQDAPADVPALESRTAYRRLGCAAGDVRAALTSIEDGDRGDVSEETFLERIDEIRQALHDLRKMVRP